MDMDDLNEIQLRIAKIEEGLNEVKAMVQQAAAGQSQAVAPPPVQAPPPNPVFPSLRVGPAPKAPPTPAQQVWQQPPAATPPSPPFPARPSFVNLPKRTKREVHLRISTAPPPAAVPLARNVSAPPPYPPPPPAASPLRSGEFEANLLGSLFARIGAFAVFLGAAFAFKYAVDRNLISPAGRVAIGVLLGAAFIGWGEWARRKTWPLFAQAVAGEALRSCTSPYGPVTSSTTSCPRRWRLSSSLRWWSSVERWRCATTRWPWRQWPPSAVS